MTNDPDGAGAAAGAGWMDRRATAVTVCLAVLFAVWFQSLCLRKLGAYGYGDFDLPIFDQAVWSTARLDGFFPSSIRFGSVFTDHVPLILVAVVPLYWLLGSLVPGAVILLTVQVLAVASAALPLHLLARREAGPLAGVAVAAAYLLHPATGYLVLFEFHPGALAVPFLCWTLWALHAGRWRTFLVCAALALACREDVAFPIAGIGVWALWRAWRGGRDLRTWETLRWTAVPVVAGVVWLALVLLVIVPAAQPAGHPDGASPFVWLYAHHAPPGTTSAAGVVGALLASPIDAIATSADLPHKHVGEYTFHLLAPTGGLALLSPVALLPALPTWFLNVTSIKTETSSICYQYTANVLPFLFLGTITSLAWLRRRWGRRAVPVAVGLLVVAALASSVAWGKQVHPTADPLDAAHRPGAPRQLYAAEYERDAADAARNAVAELVPDDASLVTTFGFLHRVPMRPELWSWHYVRTGRDPITGAEVVTPQADYVLLDSADALTFGSFGGAGSGERQRAYLDGYSVIARAGPAVLLARGGGGDPVSVLAAVEERDDGPVRLPMDVLPPLNLMAADVETLPGTLVTAASRGEEVREVELRLAWAATRDLLEAAARGTRGFAAHGTLWLRVRFERDGEGAGDVRESLFALSHGLHPISEWRGIGPVGDEGPFTVTSASHRVLVPPGRWRVTLSVDRSATARPEPLAHFGAREIDVR